MNMTAQSQGQMRIEGKKAKALGGFTLVELLVVIAVTAVLLTVIFRPLVASYDLTQRAGTQIETQAAARATMSRLRTVLGGAAYVFDNAGLMRPGKTGVDTGLNLWLTDSTGSPIVVTSRYSMVEYVPAAKQLEQVADSQLGAPIDPTTGEPIYDRYGSSAQSGVAVPVIPGRILGRIFLALVNNASVNDTHTVRTALNPFDAVQNGMPIKPYANRFEDVRTVSPSNDNRYTLWQAEVPIYVVDPTTPNSKSYVPNLRLFHIKDSSNNVHDNIADYMNPTTRASLGLRLVLHDPNFFYDNQLAGDGSKVWAVPGWVDINGDGKVEIWENWQAVASNIGGNDRKVDMVSLERDQNTNAIVYYDAMGTRITSGMGWPRVRPLVRFAPATVQNDLGVASALDSSGNEAPNPVPSLFATQFTHWANPYRVLVYRTPLDAANLEYYETTDDGRIVHVPSLAKGTPGPDPYTLTDVGPNPDPVTGAFRGPGGDPTAIEYLYTADSERGTINFAYPSSVLIHDAAGNPLTAVFDPKKVNATADTSDPPRRYLSLETLDPAMNPSIADATIHPLSKKMKWYADVQIVPGTEIVFGPDQRPGPHYGYRVQYTRIPSKSADAIGPNEYKINYQNENDAGVQHIELSRGFLEFRSGAEGSSLTNVSDDAWASGFDPNVTYKPYGLPEHKANPNFDPTMPVSATNPKLLNQASDPIEVLYKFQVNRPNDVVKVDYLTRELMNVSLEVRLYDLATGRPLSTALAERLKVRNLQH